MARKFEVRQFPIYGSTDNGRDKRGWNREIKRPINGINTNFGLGNLFGISEKM
jgi:hypothetical protein